MGLIGGSTLAACDDFLARGNTAGLDAQQFFLNLTNLNDVHLALLRGDQGVLQGLPVFSNRLRVVGEISRGGMGVVYQAWDVHIQRMVAVKEMLTSHHSSHKAFLRFQAEARSMAAIRHPAVVSVYSVGTSQRGTPYLVMEFVAGATLSDVVKLVARGHSVEEVLKPGNRVSAGLAASPTQLDIQQVAAWGCSLAAGLQACHDQGVIHRDVKPSNVLIDQDGCAKLTDFGVALDPKGHHERLTAPGGAVGTPLYMAPENLLGSREFENVGPSADVYSLGATLFTALTGSPPFVAASQQELFVKVYSGDVSPLSDFRDDVPAGLQAVLAKCLLRDPAQRYQTAAEVREALGQYATGGHAQSMPAGLGRNPKLFLLLVVLLLLGVLSALAWLGGS
ncbi:MAG TPA: hypothetical protein DEA08_16550 [Planctomycetes bacterium]|nr:hypothetical protein [Planctomycetota bacterium]